MNYRKVVLKVEIEYVAEVPDDFTEEQIDFHRNESSWCVDNGIDELQALFDVHEDNQNCFCGQMLYSYIREATEKDIARQEGRYLSGEE